MVKRIGLLANKMGLLIIKNGVLTKRIGLEAFSWGGELRLINHLESARTGWFRLEPLTTNHNCGPNFQM